MEKSTALIDLIGRASKVGFRAIVMAAGGALLITRAVINASDDETEGDGETFDMMPPVCTNHGIQYGSPEANLRAGGNC